MTQAAAERLNGPISDAELERRWSAVRSAMERERLDVLLIRANNDYLGGYVKWFTDLPATTGYPVCVLFPREGRMTYVSQGQFGLDRPVAPAEQPVYRGIGRLLGAPGYASVSSTLRYEVEAVGEALAPYAGARLAIIGPASWPHALMVRVLESVGRAAPVADASELVDAIKARKSPEEVARIRLTARMQDECMAAVFAQIRPGMRAMDVSSIAERVGREHGSEQGVYLCGAGPVGQCAPYAAWHYQHRPIAAGDCVNVLVENNGRGGFYTELGRSCVLGRATDELRAEHAFAVRAQDHAAALLRPGASCAGIWRAYNEFVVAHGRPEERRLFCHGQGYDLVEAPLVRHDEAMQVDAGMNFACHPTFVSATAFATCCDNFLVGAGGAERLHRFARELVELG